MIALRCSTPAPAEPHAARVSDLADALIMLRQTYGEATTAMLIQQGFSRDEIDAYAERAVAQAARRERSGRQHGRRA